MGISKVVRGTSTFTEMLFLDGIMHNEWLDSCPLERKIKALKCYMENATHRQWDKGVDPIAVKRYAQVLLEQLDGTCKN